MGYNVNLQPMGFYFVISTYGLGKELSYSTYGFSKGTQPALWGGLGKVGSKTYGSSAQPNGDTPRMQCVSCKASMCINYHRPDCFTSHPTE